MRHRLWSIASTFAACIVASGALYGTAHAAASTAKQNIIPPWQNGKNNDALERGLELTVPPVDNLADFHGSLDAPKLVLYVGGNYFFAMAPLVEEFEKKNPDYKGHVYWETLPPGFLEKQIRAQGTVTVGNMTWTVKADAYFAGLKKVQGLIEAGLLEKPAVPYATNTLTIMVPKDNPAHVTGLKDLGKANVRLVMPNPQFEGVARQIQASLKKAGGDDLVDEVYHKKVSSGGTVLTQIHHRQTPLFLMEGRADAGVTWKSEAMFQEQAGHSIAHVDIPDNENATAIYAGALVKDAPHAKAARAWLDFIRSPAALAIFQRYGFKAYPG